MASHVVVQVAQAARPPRPVPSNHLRSSFRRVWKVSGENVTIQDWKRMKCVTHKRCGRSFRLIAPALATLLLIALLRINPGWPGSQVIIVRGTWRYSKRIELSLFHCQKQNWTAMPEVNGIWSWAPVRRGADPLYTRIVPLLEAELNSHGRRIEQMSRYKTSRIVCNRRLALGQEVWRQLGLCW